MKSLQESVARLTDLYVVYPLLSESACEMITETLAEPHLLELARQLKNDKCSKLNNFSDIFRDLCIRFDQIDSSNVKEYSGDTLAKGIQASRKVLNNNSGFVLVTGADGRYKYCFVSVWGKKSMVTLDINYRGWVDVKPAEVYSYLETASSIIVYNCDMKALSNWDLRNKRRSSQQGTVPVSSDKTIVGWNNRTAWEEYCYNMAEENRKRYKEICASNKTKKNIDFKRIDDMVQTCLNRLMKATMNAKQNPEKYADQSYELAYMCTRVYDQKRPSTLRRGEMIGNDGVLRLYSEYNKLYMNLVNQKSYSLDYDKKALNSVSRQIERTIDDLNPYFLKFDA